MTNFKRYFRSHLKANIKPFIYIAAAVLVLTFIIAFYAQQTRVYNKELEQIVDGYSPALGTPVAFAIILSYVIPVLEFSFFKKRNHLDCAYSLPISRRAMGAVHYLTGLIMLIGGFTMSYLTNLSMLYARGSEWVNLPPILAHYFLCLILIFVMYSVMVFVFNEANTKGDGIWFMVLYTFVFAIAFDAVVVVIDNYGYGVGYIYTEGAISWGTITAITTHYDKLAQQPIPEFAIFWQTPEYIACFIFWIIAGIASTVGLFFTFGKRAMQKTEEISNSFFGYRVLIPIFAICGMTFFEVSEFALFWVIIECLAILGYTIYRRGFHYKKRDIAILVALFAFLF